MDPKISQLPMSPNDIPAIALAGGYFRAARNLKPDACLNAGNDIEKLLKTGDLLASLSNYAHGFELLLKSLANIIPEIEGAKGGHKLLVYFEELLEKTHLSENISKFLKESDGDDEKADNLAKECIKKLEVNYQPTRYFGLNAADKNTFLDVEAANLQTCSEILDAVISTFPNLAPFVYPEGLRESSSSNN